MDRNPTMSLNIQRFARGLHSEAMLAIRPQGHERDVSWMESCAQLTMWRSATPQIPDEEPYASTVQSFLNEASYSSYYLLLATRDTPESVTP
jgi:hypothetical protein